MPKPTKRTKASRENGKKGGRPPMPPEDRRVKWDGRLAPWTVERLRAMSAIYGASQSTLVDFAVRAFDPKTLPTSKPKE